MKQFYVTWSWFDQDYEESITIDRAIMSGVAKDTVLAQAKSLCPKVAYRHNDKYEAYPPDLEAECIEVRVLPLEAWLQSLKDNAEKIMATMTDPDDEEEE